MYHSVDPSSAESAVYRPEVYRPLAPPVAAQNAASLAANPPPRPRAEAWTTEARASFGAPASRLPSPFGSRASTPQQRLPPPPTNAALGPLAAAAAVPIVADAAVPASVPTFAAVRSDRPDAFAALAAAATAAAASAVAGPRGATPTRSQAAQTRPPFTLYNPQTYNAMVPRPVQRRATPPPYSEEGHSPNGARQRVPSTVRASGAGGGVSGAPCVVLRPRSVVTVRTSDEVGLVQTNHALSRVQGGTPRPGAARPAARLPTTATTLASGVVDVVGSAGAVSVRPRSAGRGARSGGGVVDAGAERAALGFPASLAPTPCDARRWRFQRAPLRPRPNSATRSDRRVPGLNAGSGHGAVFGTGRVDSHWYVADGEAQTEASGPAPLGLDAGAVRRGTRLLLDTDLFVCVRCHAVMSGGNGGVSSVATTPGRTNVGGGTGVSGAGVPAVAVACSCGGLGVPLLAALDAAGGWADAAGAAASARPAGSGQARLPADAFPVSSLGQVRGVLAPTGATAGEAPAPVVPPVLSSCAAGAQSAVSQAMARQPAGVVTKAAFAVKDCLLWYE